MAPRKSGSGPLAAASVAAFNSSEDAKGVVYLSRIPPYMRAIKVRQLLSAYGELGRLYLAPEEAGAYARRVRAGGNKRVQFTEGWVEFLDKRVARATAESIHGTRVGDGAGVHGRAKRGFYGDDLWSVRYLRGFKWHHLTEMAGYERRIKGARLRTAIAGARKEADAYLARVDQAQGLAAQAARRASLPAKAGGEDESAGALLDAARRRFRQRDPLKEAGET